MDVREYIEYIRKEIDQKKDYKDYIHAFQEYEIYLKERMKKEPENIELICQYSMVMYTLRKPDKESIGRMEQALVSLGSNLSEFGRYRLHVNIAGLLEGGEECISHLEKAVNLGLPIPNAYDALAKCYIEDQDYVAAEPLEYKAMQYADKLMYQYNYAVCLYENGKIAQAKGLIKELLAKEPDDCDLLYAYASCCFYLGEREQCVAVIRKIKKALEEGVDFEITQLADLYFICERYEEYNSIYDHSEYPYAIRGEWIECYLYSLKQQGKSEELHMKYDLFQKEMKEEYDGYLEARAELEMEEEELEYCRAEYDKESRQLQRYYHNLNEYNEKPTLNIVLNIKYECYMIDCPMHQTV